MNTEAVALREADALPVWNPKQVVAQVNLIQQIMRDVMHKDEHYGTIPGTNKPTLLKPGAEKLCLTFRLAPSYEITERDLGTGHREYRIVCRLTSIQTGVVIGDGLGICSTMESKYRYRHADPEDTGTPVPGPYWEAKKANNLAKMAELTGGKGFVAKKNKAGQWTIHKIAADRVDNPDIADVYNTVLKMAKKRAMVDAAITATGASDIFTQDLEETVDAPVATPTAHVELASGLSVSVSPSRVEPPPPKDVSPEQKSLLELLTVDQWKSVYEAVNTMESFAIVESDLQKVWHKYDGEEKTALKRMRDAKKTALMEAK